ncbi:uncharacterized protein [Montipora foliosa]|uniref:uncharacterized protein isoform X2 n=1 Tax=Montipora foliosa TaxID=591990 RepID=UPI0035F1E5A0
MNRWSTCERDSPSTITGDSKRKQLRKGLESSILLLGVKHKKPDPPEFPNGRPYTATTEDEWAIYKEFLIGIEGKEYELVVKAREVVLQTVASHLKEHEPPKGTSSDLSDKKGSKRGRPKSARKELDNELFTKLKKSNIDQEDSDIYRHEFQKKKLDEFQKGHWANQKWYLEKHDKQTYIDKFLKH